MQFENVIMLSTARWGISDVGYYKTDILQKVWEMKPCVKEEKNIQLWSKVCWVHIYDGYMETLTELILGFSDYTCEEILKSEKSDCPKQSYQILLIFIYPPSLPCWIPFQGGYVFLNI